MLEEMFKSKLVLRPNCLLTRKPICFITPSHPLIHLSKFFKTPWDESLYFLKEHGYKVQLEETLPNSSKYHIILDRRTALALPSETLKSLSPTIIVAENADLSGFRDRDSLQFLTMNYPYNSRLWNTMPASLIDGLHPNEIMLAPPREALEVLLDHCVLLAESDYLEEP